MSSIIDTSGIYNEIITRLEEEGAYDREAYYDLVEEILEEKREAGQLTDDDDIEEMTEVLKKRWPEAEANFSTGHETDILNEE